MKSLGDIIREKQESMRSKLSRPVEKKVIEIVVEEPLAPEEKKPKWSFNGETIEGLE